MRFSLQGKSIPSQPYRKVTDILRHLTPAQIKRLHEFIHSPYHAVHPSLIKLFDYLQKCYPAFEPASLAPPVIVKKVKSITGKRHLDNKMTQLRHAVENFLGFEFDEDASLRELNALKAYKKWRMNDEFESLSKKIRKEIDRQAWQDYKYQWRVHLFGEECVDGVLNAINRNPKHDISAPVEALKRFYFAKLLPYMLAAAGRKHIVNDSTAEAYHTPLAEFLRSGEARGLYFETCGAAYFMLTEPDEQAAAEYFRQVKSAVKSTNAAIPPDDARMLCTALQNFIIRKINRNDLPALNEFLEIIKIRLQRGVLLEEGILRPQTFKNIITAAIKLGETAWAEKFAGDYSVHLPEDFREDSYHLAQGQIFYSMKKYDEAAKQLNWVEHNKKDAYLTFTPRKLQLKIAYETGEKDFEDRLESLRRHIERNEDWLGENAAILKKFLKYFRTLWRANGDKRKLQSLLGKLRQEGDFADKDWLLAMAGDKKFVARGSSLR